MTFAAATILEAYAEWREDRFRRCVDPTGMTQTERRIIPLMYEGLRAAEIERRTGCAGNTTGKVRNRLWAFLKAHRQFQRPMCKCGNELWHRAICPVWDAYHPIAIAKGHATQKRLRKQRDADSYFQSLDQAQTMTRALTKQPTLEEQIVQFTDLIQKGIDAWTDAGALLVKMLDANPSTRSIILESCADITEEILARFEGIGRKQIHPKTLLNNSPGMRRLRDLPYSEQERFLSTPVPLVIRKGGSTDVLQVSIQNLTSDQATQVMSSDGVRTPAAQRAWLEAHRGKVVLKGKPYRIQGNKVIFRAGCELTARELATLLAEMN